MTTDSGNAATVEWRVFDDARLLADETRSDRSTAEVDSALIDAYQHDGVVLIPGAFTEWVEPLRAGLDRILGELSAYAFPCESTSPDEPGRFFDAYCNWQRVPEFLDFVLRSPAASIAAQLMQSETAQLFHEHAFAKEAGTQKPTPWHQDTCYYNVEGHDLIRAWVCVDHAPRRQSRGGARIPLVERHLSTGGGPRPGGRS